MSGGKCGRFSEEYLKCGRFYKTIYMRLIYHKCWRLPTNTGELEFMAWDAMLRFFYNDLSHYKERQYFVIPFIADIRN